MKISWDGWTRHRKTLVWNVVENYGPEPLQKILREIARVERAGNKRWRAVVDPRGKGQYSETFRRMEDALLWAEPRITLVLLERLA